MMTTLLDDQATADQLVDRLVAVIRRHAAAPTTRQAGAKEKAEREIQDAAVPLITHWVSLGRAGKPHAQDIVRHCNGRLYTEIGDQPFPLPSVWSQFIAAYGETFVNSLPRQGMATIRMQILHATERDPLAVQAALRKAGLL